jgi:hypothetical protein
MYVKGKMRPAETVPGRRIKGNDGGGEFNYDML